MGKDVRNPSLVQQTLSGTMHWQTSGQLFALLLCWSTWHCWLFPPWNTTLSKIPYYGAQRDLSICLFCRLFSMSLWILECSISLPLFFLTSWLSDILTAQNSYLCLTHLFICLPNISSWMSERQLKFNMFKSWVIPSISLVHTPQVFPMLVNTQLITQALHLDSSFTTLLFTLTPNLSESPIRTTP